MSTPALVRLDKDDPRLPDYMMLERPRGWIFLTGVQAPISAYYNAAFSAHPNLPWYGFLADDVVPGTHGWDRILTDAATPDGLAFGNDSINGGSHATHFVLGGELVRETGWLSLPGLERLYIDTVWSDIARNKDVFHYLPHVKMTHHHFTNGRALMDSIYRKPAKEADKQIYQIWKEAQ